MKLFDWIVRRGRFALPSPEVTLELTRLHARISVLETSSFVLFGSLPPQERQSVLNQARDLAARVGEQTLPPYVRPEHEQEFRDEVARVYLIWIRILERNR